jgi:hypothetical protein
MTINVQAFLNHGRWLVTCPDCGVALLAQPELVCPVCFPSIQAKAFQPIQGGLLRPVDDVEIIERTRLQAREAGRELNPIYPVERQQIEKILRQRPSRANFNWVPGETLEILRQQNRDHGDPVPEEE